MMKNLLTLLILLFTLLSCVQKKEKELIEETLEYYPDNQNQVYLRKLKNVEYDSVFYYYDNGALFKSGRSRKNGKPYGIWKLYSKNGNLREIREWFVLGGHSRINRVWFLDKKGDTIAWRSQDSIFKQKEFIHDTLGIRATDYNVFRFNKDTISLDEPIRGIAYCNSRRIRDYDSQIRIFFHSESEDFNSPFPNDSLIRANSFDNLKTDSINHKWFTKIEPSRYGHVAIFGSLFKNPGKKLLRGYMEEYSYGPFEEDIDSLTARVYFEKNIYVKDSID